MLDCRLKTPQLSDLRAIGLTPAPVAWTYGSGTSAHITPSTLLNSLQIDSGCRVQPLQAHNLSAPGGWAGAADFTAQLRPERCDWVQDVEWQTSPVSERVMFKHATALTCMSQASLQVSIGQQIACAQAAGAMGGWKQSVCNGFDSVACPLACAYAYEASFAFEASTLEQRLRSCLWSSAITLESLDVPLLVLGGVTAGSVHDAGWRGNLETDFVFGITWGMSSTACSRSVVITALMQTIADPTPTYPSTQATRISGPPVDGRWTQVSHC